MCGIIAYCGQQVAQPVLLEGLQKLEYRGYDSAGLACVAEPDLHTQTGGKPPVPSFATRKVAGKVADLRRWCESETLPGRSGIAHCRWATHGAVNWANAHPHCSADAQVALVHNGIIDNYQELRQFLQGQGLDFCSQSDSESAANLLAYLLRQSGPAPGSLASVLQVMQGLRHWLRGSYALAVLFALRPHEVYAIRCESPMVVGLAQDGNYFASDVLALPEGSQGVVYLQDHQLARIYRRPFGPPGLELYGADGRRQTAEISSLPHTAEDTGKQGYAHYMVKEIHQQPQVFAQLQQRHIRCAGAGLQVQFDLNSAQQDQLAACRQLVFVSCGTSYHASIYAKYVLEALCGLPIRAEYASEFRYRQPVLGGDTAVIGLSQSGETADTLAALRLAQERGAATVALVNVPSSSMARSAELLLDCGCGAEIGVASTKVYTAQLLLLYYFGLYLGALRSRLDAAAISQRLHTSRRLPALAEQILSQAEALQALAQDYAGYRHILYLGRGLYYPLALEGALKLKEISYIHAEGYAAAELKHGPLALIDQQTPVVALMPSPGLLCQKIQHNVAEVRARGGRVLAFVHQGPADETPAAKCRQQEGDVFVLPTLSKELDPLLCAIPLQLFAYYIAVAKGLDPDQPRHLAKSVTVE